MSAGNGNGGDTTRGPLVKEGSWGISWLLPLLGILAIAIGLAVGHGGRAPLADAPKKERPQVNFDQRADHSVENPYTSEPLAENALPSRLRAPGSRSDPNAPSGAGHAREQGTEFLPVIFGYRVKVTDFLLALFTFALAAFTYGLKKSTDRLWYSAEEQLSEFRRSLKHAEATAVQQASLMGRQLDTMTAQIGLMERLERPLLLPRPAGWGIVGWKDNANKAVFRPIEIDFENHGRSSAIVDYARLAIVVSREPPQRVDGETWSYSPSLGDIRTRTYYTDFMWTRRAIPPGESLGPHEIECGSLRPDQIDEIGTGNQRLWLDGFLLYRDLAGKRCETHVRWVYDTHLDMMILDGGTEFNRYT